MTASTDARDFPALEMATALQAPDDGAGRANLLLLVQLRWIAVVGQMVTIAGVGLGLGVTLPLGAMATVLASLAALNLASLWRLSRPAPVAGRGSGIVVT